MQSAFINIMPICELVAARLDAHARGLLKHEFLLILKKEVILKNNSFVKSEKFVGTNPGFR